MTSRKILAALLCSGYLPVSYCFAAGFTPKVVPTTPRPRGPTIPSVADLVSEDPLVYTIPNLLTVEECEEYQSYVISLQERTENPRKLTLSNPPEVSLDVLKLWPLPVFSVLAGLPSLFKLEGSVWEYSFPELCTTVSGPISIALGLTLILVVLAQPLVQAVSNASARTSVALALNQEEDMDFVRPLVERIEDATGLAWHHWEAPVVTKYDPGAIFAKHGDASPTKGTEWKDDGGQRILTCICYLNSLKNNASQGDTGGGETYFDQLQVAIEPSPGKALIFVPADWESLDADDRTTHESLPPTSSYKWIVQLFGRVGPRVPTPLGLPDAYGSGDTAIDAGR